MRAKDRVGVDGEEIAVEHLRRAGLLVLDRNWRCELGELDVVARDGDDLVVVEVKTRTSLRFGTPLEAATADKLRRVRRLGLRWLDAHRHLRGAPLRVDVVAVLQMDGRTEVQHLRGVG